MTKFYYGGQPNLQPGDIVEPAHLVETHEACTECDELEDGLRSGEIVWGSQVIFFSEERLYAKFYSTLYGRGWLYLVEPVGEYESSKLDRMQSCTTGHLRIVRIVEKSVILKPNEMRQIRRSELRYRKEMAKK